MDSLKQTMMRSQVLRELPHSPPCVAELSNQPATAERSARSPAHAQATMDARFLALHRKLDTLIGMLKEPGDEQDSTKQYVPLQAIRRMVTQYYAVCEQDLDRDDRKSRIARIRQIAYYLCRSRTTRSLPEIAKAFGGRNHSTILHGIRKIEVLRCSDTELDSDLSKLESRIAALLKRRSAAASNNESET